MDRDSVGENVKLDNLRSKERMKLDIRDGGKENACVENIIFKTFRMKSLQF
jgi:hypothetical protein